MKPSKSFLRRAECVAVADQQNVLSRFLNKRTIVPHLGLGLTLSAICRFFVKPSKSILSGAECVAVADQQNVLARFLNKRALVSHLGLSVVFS